MATFTQFNNKQVNARMASLMNSTSNDALASIIASMTYNALINGTVNAGGITKLLESKAAILEVSIGNTTKQLQSYIRGLMPVVTVDGQLKYDSKKGIKICKRLSVTFQDCTFEAFTAALVKEYTEVKTPAPKAFKATNFDKKVEKAQSLSSIEIEAELKAVKQYLENLKRLQASKLAMAA